MRYTVFLAQPAQKFLSRLTDRTQRARFERVIDSLAENPRPHGCQPLHGMRGAYRVRIGGFRILYQIEDDRLIILVTDIGTRGQIYR
ncbi:MAG: type II toxin-antitoxin system RelE/ParE family toxin [Opitutus sp.]|nr:type II toxin-antitoxin system RelE/ParE family toxin [Opitutus sp.]